MHAIGVACLLLVLTMPPAEAAGETRASRTVETVEDFLHGATHGFLPYAFPAETRWEELDQVLSRGFDTVGVTFCGPYAGGAIDFGVLDEAVRRIDATGARALLHIMPRFELSEGIADTLSDGSVLRHVWNQSPHYSVIDVFCATQAARFNRYLELAADRYGDDSRVAGFCIDWGFQGETGFFTGDFNAGHERMGTVSAGYSNHALDTFNRWRAVRGAAPVAALPIPSATGSSAEFVDFMHFRHDWLSERFQAEAVRAMKARTDKPVGTFAYLPAGKESYARNWCPVPAADFYRSAGSAASYDNRRTLSDSGIGWEDSLLHGGVWDKTSAAMIRDQWRMMAHGAAFHAMWCRHYEAEPGWEPGLYNRVAAFIRDEAPAARRQIRPATATVGLFLPTWSCAAWPGHSEAQPFLIRADLNHFIRRHVGIVESFGLSYDLLTEADLADPACLDAYELVLLVAANRLDVALGEAAARSLHSRPHVRRVDYEGNPPTRSGIRDLLVEAGIPLYLDHDGEDPLAGRVNNVLFNFGNAPVRVRLAGRDGVETVALGAHEVRVLEGRYPLP